MTHYLNPALIEKAAKSVEGEVVIGLYQTVYQPKDAWRPEGLIISAEPFIKTIYGDQPEPEEKDYYYCYACKQRHLRECFDDSPPIIGTEEWMSYRVELPPQGGYQSQKTFLEQHGTALKGEKVKFINQGDKDWEMTGFFMLQKGLVIYYQDELGAKTVPKKVGEVHILPKLQLNAT